MKKIKTAVVLILCACWIFITNYEYKPINAVGTLLTYKTGLLSIPIQESSIKEVSSNYKSNIYVDDVGVPHVYGTHKNDVAFGLGYMHAKDRYFQMEMMSRTVQGEMSEIFSEESLGSDIFWKPYEFERKSNELLEDYKRNAPEFYQYLIAYSDGINTYLKDNKNTDPLYSIFGETPRLWKPQYSLLVTWYMSWSLTYFDEHVDLNGLYTKLSDKEREYFYPLQPEGLKTILPSSDSSVVVIEENKLLEEIISYQSKEKLDNPLGFHQGIGSNNWVVNSSKTKNGSSILANDPHLFLTLPEAFYEAHLVSDSFAVYGFSIPGVPVIVSGHNEQVSWGITNGEWDLIDRYLLKVKNGNEYLYEGNWTPFDKKQYTIKVKGFDDYIITQETTIHGKVIKEEETYYAQHWYASNKSYSIESMYKMMQSQNWNDFTNALKTYGYPPQNFIYNDINDQIGIVCAGQLPDRDASYRGEILDGTKKYQKRNALDTLWYTQNPNKNYLFSANQQPIQNDTYFGYHGLKDDYRVDRINSLLNKKNDWGIQEIQKMQSDEVDLSFFEFRDLLQMYKVSEKHKEIANKLLEWDGDMKGQSSEALLYEFIRISVEEEAELFAEKYLKVNKAPSFKFFTKYLKDQEYTVPNSISKQEIFNNIFSSVDAILERYSIADWEQETYKNLSSININNITSIPGLGERIVGVGGNTNTINMNTTYYRPVFRSVYEMGKDNTIKGYTILAGGQSGKINSPNYKDQLEKWINGEYKESQFKSNPNQLENIKNIIKLN